MRFGSDTSPHLRIGCCRVSDVAFVYVQIQQGGEKLDSVQRLMPRKIKKRRKAQNEDGVYKNFVTLQILFTFILMRWKYECLVS